MATRQAQLDALKQQILDNKVCPELAAGATQLVFSDGSADAQVVFIGEAPGKQEDLLGLPFVGASGKFLDEMLMSIGMKREDIYITNIVKYRPPNNRDPLPDEKRAFLPYLQEQLEIIQPKLIVALGRHSGGAFLPDLRISQDHGKPKRIQLQFHDDKTKSFAVVVLPLYHPAAALYNGGMRETLVADFALIPAILEKVNEEQAK